MDKNLVVAGIDHERMLVIVKESDKPVPVDYTPPKTLAKIWGYNLVHEKDLNNLEAIWSVYKNDGKTISLVEKYYVKDSLEAERAKDSYEAALKMQDHGCVVEKKSIAEFFQDKEENNGRNR